MWVVGCELSWQSLETYYFKCHSKLIKEEMTTLFINFRGAVLVGIVDFGCDEMWIVSSIYYVEELSYFP